MAEVSQSYGRNNTLILEIPGDCRQTIAAKRMCCKIDMAESPLFPAGPGDCLRTRWCYCWSCQVDRLSIHAHKPPDVLWGELNIARRREKRAIETAFTEVLNQISISKAFRQQIYNLFKYKNTACYFKSIKGDSKEDAAEKAKVINRECLIYDKFNQDLHNKNKNKRSISIFSFIFSYWKFLLSLKSLILLQLVLR